MQDGDEAFPPSLSLLSACLTSLDLSRNPLLLSLPSSIPALSSLTLLALGGCGLSSLPDSLALSCHALEHLDLSCNALSSLPSSLSKASRLRCLRFQSNNIASCPSLGACSSLELLTASHNSLSVLPTLPPGLRTLHASCNCISKLTQADADGLGSATDLDLNGNGIASVPAALSASLSCASPPSPLLCPLPLPCLCASS